MDQKCKQHGNVNGLPETVIADDDAGLEHNLFLEHAHSNRLLLSNFSEGNIQVQANIPPLGLQEFGQDSSRPIVDAKLTLCDDVNYRISGQLSADATVKGSEGAKLQVLTKSISQKLE